MYSTARTLECIPTRYLAAGCTGANGLQGFLLSVPSFMYFVAVKVVTGSFQGVLRVYLPKERDFKVEDVLLEIELDQAILQLEAGVFTS